MIHIIDDYYVTGGARDYTLLKDTHREDKNGKDYKLRLDERAILNHYGITEQVAKLKEEAYELIEASDGYINGTDSKAHFLEEMADVEVVIEQMIMHFNAQDKVDEIKRFKVKRQLGRMERE